MTDTIPYRDYVLGKSLTTLAKYNPNHDKLGRFASGGEFDGPVLHRGLNVKLTPELQQQISGLLEPATHPDEYNQHLKIGPLIAEHLHNFDNPNYSSGLGRHWTSSKEFAETAGVAGNIGGMPIVISARTRTKDVETDPRRLIGNRFHGEDETTFVPGAKFEIVDMRIGYYSGGRMERVWDTEGVGTGRRAWEKANNTKYDPDEWGESPLGKAREVIAKYNANHDRLGRFASSSGSSGTGTASNPVSFNDLGATWRDNARTEAAIKRFNDLPDDAVITVYHGTNATNARGIITAKQVVEAERRATTTQSIASSFAHTYQKNDLYVAPTHVDAERYGGIVLKFNVRKGDLQSSIESSAIRQTPDVGKALFGSYAGATIPSGTPIRPRISRDTQHMIKAGVIEHARDVISKYNMFHDRIGRFASAQGGGGGFPGRAPPKDPTANTLGGGSGKKAVAKTPEQKDKEFSRLSQAQQKAYNAAPRSMDHDAAIAHAKTVRVEFTGTRNTRGMSEATPAQRKNGVTDDSGVVHKIPPAWDKVFVSKTPAGVKGLLMSGVDVAGRVQPRYTTKHTANASARKYDRINKLSPKLKGLDDHINAGVAKGDPRAVALALIRHQGLRPGSMSETGGRKPAFGATTLQARHVTINGASVRLRYTGKEGVDLDFTIKSPSLAKGLAALKAGKRGTDSIFDQNVASASHVVDYMRRATGTGYSLKDLRTVRANTVAQTAVARRRQLPKSQAEFKRWRNEVATEVSSVLGNRPAQALTSYINPRVFATWEAGIGA